MKLKVPKRLIKLTGHLYFHKYPSFVVYRPNIHRVRGKDVRKILNVIEPGDILLRRFDSYLNTILTPGFWGHAGIYIGENDVVHSISQGCTQEDILNFCRADAVAVLRLKNGPMPKFREIAIALADKHVPYDYDFQSDNDAYYCTELTDYLSDWVFKEDYQMVGGNLVLTPDGMYKSEQVIHKISINYRRVKK
jgi:hypothetical protein